MKFAYKYILFFVVVFAFNNLKAQSLSTKWATYFGGDAIEKVSGLTTDKDGNTIICGKSKSKSGIVTDGAMQTKPDVENYDAFLAKFSPEGKLIWSTYYGGDFDDEGLSLSTDKSGNIFMVGNTLSKTSIATSGAYQTAISQYATSFIAKFTTEGKVIWSTYFGTGDLIRSVATLQNGDIVFTGQSVSFTSISTKGALQTSAGGYYDAFLVRFSSQGNMVWGTYYGGEKNDEGNYVVTDGKDNIYLCGQAYSQTNISTPDAQQTNLKGDENTFIARFTADGRRIWSTYLTLNNGIHITAADADLDGNLVLAGNSLKITVPEGVEDSIDMIESVEAIAVKMNENGKVLFTSEFADNTVCMGFGVAAKVKGKIVLCTFSSKCKVNMNPTALAQADSSTIEVKILDALTGSPTTDKITYKGNDLNIPSNIIADNAGNISLLATVKATTFPITSNQKPNKGLGDAYLAKLQLK